MKIVGIIARIIIGLVFVFSGFVKGVDPWGSAIKLNDYFTAFGWDFMLPYSFFIGSLMNVAEFIIGFSLLIGVKVKLGSLGALIFMAIFTPLTFYLAIANPVSDCGCFGDAIKMTNWETFYKNIFITALVLLVFFRRKKFKPLASCTKEWMIVSVGLAIIVFTTWYSYSYLPIIDFLPYKKGNNIPALMTVPEGYPTDKYDQFITLNDTSTGKNIDVTVDVYSNDSTYWGMGTKYKYVSISEPKLVSKGYQPPIHDFTIVSYMDGVDLTDIILADSSYSFLLVSYKLPKADVSHLKEIDELARWAFSQGYRFICLTSSTGEDLASFKEKYNPPYDFYMTDETTLKTMIRANPGLVLLKSGTIIDKWSQNAIPTPDQLQKEIIK